MLLSTTLEATPTFFRRAFVFKYKRVQCSFIDITPLGRLHMFFGSDFAPDLTEIRAERAVSTRTGAVAVVERSRDDEDDDDEKEEEEDGDDDDDDDDDDDGECEVGTVNEVSGTRGCAAAAPVVAAAFFFLRRRALVPIKAPLPPEDDDDDEDAVVACMGASRRAKMSFLSDNLTFLTCTDALRPTPGTPVSVPVTVAASCAIFRLFLAAPTLCLSVNVCACMSPRL